MKASSQTEFELPRPILGGLSMAASALYVALTVQLGAALAVVLSVKALF